MDGGIVASISADVVHLEIQPQGGAIAGPVDLKHVEKMSLKELHDALRTDADGLSATEAAERLDVYGPNEIQEEKENPLWAVHKHFWGSHSLDD